MDAKPTADMALRHKGLIVGVKTAHYSGPEWTPVERAVEAGTIANIPVMVDFGTQSPRAAAERTRHEEAAAGRHLYPPVFGPAQRTGRIRPREPGALGGQEARRHLRRRPRRRQLPVAHCGAGSESGIPSGLDLHRSAHRQHERRHEGHAQRDGQVPRDGRAARRGDAARRRGIRRSRSATRNWGTCHRAPWPTSPCSVSRRGSFGFVDMYGARLQGTRSSRPS